MNAFDDSGHSGDFFISTDKNLINLRWIASNLLSQSWADTWDGNRMQKAINNSLCFGVYKREFAEVEGGKPLGFVEKQVGFARVLSDGATYSMVVDVVIDPAFRKRGLAKFLMAEIIRHESVRNTVSLLRTSNAQRLYGRFDYHEVPAMRRIPKL